MRWPLFVLAVFALQACAEPTCALSDCDPEQSEFLAEVFPACAAKIVDVCADPSTGCACQIREIVEPEFMTCSEGPPPGTDDGDFGSSDGRLSFLLADRRVDEVRVLDAFPAVSDGSGGWRRACGEPAATHAMLEMVATTVGPQPEDGDRGVGLSDPLGRGCRVVEGGHALDPTPSSGVGFALEVDCAEDGDSAPPQGCPETSWAAREVPSTGGGATQNEGVRGAGHVVIILVDMSGSTFGVVESGTLAERTQPKEVPANFATVASDFRGERFSVVREVLDTFDPGDRVGVLMFAERLDGGTLVPCTAGSLATCFGDDTVQWLADGTFDQGSADTGGRANIWQAVATAHDFLAGVSEPRQSRHILVISDGPDTCQGGADPDCSSVGSAEVLAKVEAAAAPPIAIHFAQFEAPGYLGRDPQQLAVACASGGHYRYINSEALSKTSNHLAESLSDAALHIRYAFRGTLHTVVELSSLLPEPAPTGLALLTGTLRLDGDDWGWAESRSSAFGKSGAGWAGILTSLDDRVPLVLPSP